MAWLRLHLEIRNDVKLKTLSPADRWYFVALLTMKADGTIDQFSNERELLEDVICAQLSLTHDELSKLRVRLVRAQLLNNDWQPLGWSGRQYLDTSREDATERKRAQRLRDSREKVTAMSRDPSVSVSGSDSESSPDPESSLPLEEPLLKRMIDIYPSKNKINIRRWKEMSDLLDEEEEDVVLNGVRRYAKYIEDTETDDNFVMSLENFIRQAAWKRPWTYKSAKKNPNAELDAEIEEMRRQGKL